MKKLFPFRKSLALMAFLMVAVAFGSFLTASGKNVLSSKEEGLVEASFQMSEYVMRTLADTSDRYYVVFKSPPTESDENLVASKGATVRHKYSLIQGYSVSVPNDTVLNSIKADPSVEKVEQVSVVTAFDDRIPWGITAVKAPLVWDTVTGNGIKVCILDTGIDYTHPDLDDNYGGGYDFVNNDPDPWDDAGHGTHCAGIVAAEMNGSGVVGVAYDAGLYSCKVLNSQGVGYGDDILAGIEWAVNNNMDIASLSLGGGGYNPVEDQAYQDAYDAGLLIICATGNDGIASISYPAKYDSNIAVGAIERDYTRASFSNYGPEMELVAPGVNVESTVPLGTGMEAYVSEGSNTYEAIGMEYAGYTNGITATAYYCNLGETATDFPPGVMGNIALIQRGNISFADKTTNAMNAGAVGVIIYNNVPGIFLGTLGSSGAWVPVVSMSNEDGETLRALGTPTLTLVHKIGDYDYKNGTSMACPHVSGVAALVMEANDALTNVEVRDIMNDTATDLGPAGWDSEYGYGLVDAEAAVDEAIGQPQVYMFINNIRMKAQIQNGAARALAYVEIKDTNGAPVENAMVYAEWAGDIPTDIQSTDLTDINGVAVLASPWVPPHTLPTPKTIRITVIVTNVTHATFIYDPALNQVPATESIAITY